MLVGQTGDGTSPGPGNGAQSLQGYQLGISPQAQGWIVLGLFGVGFLMLFLIGHAGVRLDAGIDI